MISARKAKTTYKLAAIVIFIMLYLAVNITYKYVYTRVIYNTFFTKNMQYFPLLVAVYKIYSYICH